MNWNINQAKEGDIVADADSDYPFVGIFKNLNPDGSFNTYCFLGRGTQQEFEPPLVGGLTGELSTDNKNPDGIVIATEAQKKLLFDKIKEAGYVWNAETKEIEKSEERKRWNPLHMVFHNNDETIPCRTCSAGWRMPWTTKRLDNGKIDSTFQWMCRCRCNIYHDSVPSYNRDCTKVQKWIEEHKNSLELVHNEYDWYQEPWYYFTDPHYMIKED